MGGLSTHAVILPFSSESVKGKMPVFWGIGSYGKWAENAPAGAFSTFFIFFPKTLMLFGTFRHI